METNNANRELEEVVFDSIRFLESITRYYGAERGIEMWNAMGDAMGDDVKGQVFFAMLTGESSNRVRIKAGTATDVVGVIKAIRGGTGYGLKEAKDAWDLSRYQTVTLDNVQRDEKSGMVRKLRDLGVIVT